MSFDDDDDDNDDWNCPCVSHSSNTGLVVESAVCEEAQIKLFASFVAS